MNIKEWLETNQIEMLTDYPYCRVVKAESVLEFFASQQAEPVARACGNEECNWSGKTERMCGEIGPLCPECGETTELVAPSQDVEEFVLNNSFSTAFYNEPQYVILTSVFEAWMAGHARVPEEADPLPDNYSNWDVGYNEGWNACREAMLTASKESGK